MDRTLIDRFARGGEQVIRALAGLSHEDLLAHPGPGAWSIQELVIHLADSDAIAIDRMKRIITEDNPTLIWADESAYVQKLFCHEQSSEDAALLIDVGRRQFARVLRCLPDDWFNRIGTHNTMGQVTLGALVAEYADHVDHHLRFVFAKRERLRKPIAERPA